MLELSLDHFSDNWVMNAQMVARFNELWSRGTFLELFFTAQINHNHSFFLILFFTLKLTSSFLKKPRNTPLKTPTLFGFSASGPFQTSSDWSQWSHCLYCLMLEDLLVCLCSLNECKIGCCRTLESLKDSVNAVCTNVSKLFSYLLD